MGDVDFLVEDTISRWAEYGITERIGHFGNLPRKYKVIEIRTKSVSENVVKNPDFVPLPNPVARSLVDRLAEEFRLNKTSEEERGTRYTAVLQSSEVQKEVKVGDAVSWGIIVSNDVVGSFRVNSHLLRLVCANGLIMPANARASNVRKSYDVEQIYGELSRTARALQEIFEEEVETLRRLKQYRMNREFAEVLAQRFPRPILHGLVDVKIEDRARIVQDFEKTDLYNAYQIVTYNLSHRPMSLRTRLEWGTEATRLFIAEVRRQEQADAVE